MSGSGRTGDALVELLRRRHDDGIDPGRILSDVDEQTLCDLVERHRISGLVCDVLGDDPALSESSTERLVALRREAWARNIRAGRTAARVADALDAAIGSHWVIMKGPALAHWYGSPHQRGYVDLDLLVPRRVFGDAMVALEDAGFPPLTGNWTGFLDHGVAEVPMGSFDMVIDLHWHTVALESTRRQFAFDIEAMIDRQDTFESGGRSLPTFDPEDTLLHLCSHGGLAGMRRLVWMLDVDAVIRSGRIDWPEFCARAHRMKVAALAALVLDRAARLLDTPVPEAVIDELGVVPTWTRLGRLSERPRSDEQRLNGWYSGALPSVTRDRALDIVRSTAEAVREEIRVRRGGAHLAHDGGDIDWHGPDSGDVGRRRWIEYAESGVD